MREWLYIVREGFRFYAIYIDESSKYIKTVKLIHKKVSINFIRNYSIRPIFILESRHKYLTLPRYCSHSKLGEALRYYIDLIELRPMYNLPHSEVEILKIEEKY